MSLPIRGVWPRKPKPKSNYSPIRAKRSKMCRPYTPIPGPAWVLKLKTKSAAKFSNLIRSIASSWRLPSAGSSLCIACLRIAAMKSRRKFSMAGNPRCSINRKIVCTCRKPSCTHFFARTNSATGFFRAASRANRRIRNQLKRRKTSCENACTQAEKSCTCLFRGPRYLDHHYLAQGELWLRSDRHDWRRRPAGRSRSRPQESTGYRGFLCLRGRSARGIYSRLHLADAACRRGVRTYLFAGNVDGATGAWQASSRTRARTRRGRPVAWLHRQRQRPGALRTGVQSDCTESSDHCPLARVGHRFARRRHCLRRKAQHPHRAEQKKYLQPRPQYLAPQPRRCPTGRSRERSERSQLAVDRFAGKSPRPSRRSGNRFRSGHTSFRQRSETCSNRIAQLVE